MNTTATTTPPITPVTVAVIGLGYVGLPLVVEFGKHTRTIGFDIVDSKVKQCRTGDDPSREISKTNMRLATHASYTSDPAALREADFILVAVPTPVDSAHIPDFGPLLLASRAVGENLRLGATVVYESTVYPGATEEICIPALEQASGLTWKRDFFVGYSPERINPGDREHGLTRVMKVVAGDTPDTLDKVARLYEMIVEPGVHRCSSIKAAEACKVIENTQRDLNIALMNELSIIFQRVGIDTQEVLEAAGTKWNFLNFRPGLVGGHCIGVDPYYLTHKAESIGYHPQIILAGRRLNDSMGAYVVTQLVKTMTQRRIHVQGSRVLVMGLTFKENCPDLRNTRVVDIVKELADYNVQADVFDPWANEEEAQHEYGITPVQQPAAGAYDAIIIAVAHHQFKAMGAAAIRTLGKPEHVLYDLKYLLPASASDLRL